jgi:hypothetical protein
VPQQRSGAEACFLKKSMKFPEKRWTGSGGAKRFSTLLVGGRQYMGKHTNLIQASESGLALLLFF